MSLRCKIAVGAAQGGVSIRFYYSCIFPLHTYRIIRICVIAKRRYPSISRRSGLGKDVGILLKVSLCGIAAVWLANPTDKAGACDYCTPVWRWPLNTLPLERRQSYLFVAFMLQVQFLCVKPPRHDSIQGYCTSRLDLTSVGWLAQSCWRFVLTARLVPRWDIIASCSRQSMDSETWYTYRCNP